MKPKFNKNLRRTLDSTRRENMWKPSNYVPKKKGYELISLSGFVLQVSCIFNPNESWNTQYPVNLVPRVSRLSTLRYTAEKKWQKYENIIL